MADRFLAGSLTRISDLDSAPFEVAPVAFDEWRDADFVVVEVLEPGNQRMVELPTGRMSMVDYGDRLIGALGVRHATLEATGGWREAGPDLEMELLTSAGVIGRLTSVAPALGRLTRVAYVGHVHRNGRPQRMDDFVPRVEPREYGTPTILIIGTSMSAGKTTAARVVIRHLARSGVAVVGAKLTGAGRYRDILTMGDAGADLIVDFVDAGLPSSVVPRARFDEAASWMLSRIQADGPDVAVVEAGASPLEPYNGAGAVEALGDNVRMVVLAASDPYAVVGVMEAFGVKPDLVAGITTNTQAGIELVERLTGVPAINVTDPASADRLDALMRSLLDL